MIIVKKRTKGEKLIKIDKIPASVSFKNENILIKIDNNRENYNMIKKNKIYKIKLFKYIYEVLTTDVNYHPYKKKIIHVNFKVI